MTDKEFNETKHRIKKAISKWHTCLGFRWWRDSSMYYHRSADAMCQATGRESTRDGMSQCAAETSVKWEYLELAIHWNCPRVFGLDDEEIDYMVRHEFAHAIVNEMREWASGDSKDAIRHEERVCTRLAMIFNWVRKVGKEESEKGARPCAKKRKS